MTLTRFIPYRKGTNWFIFDRLYGVIISKKLDYAYFIDDNLKNSGSIVIHLNDKYAIITSINDLKSTNWYVEFKPVLRGGHLYLTYDYFKWSIVDWFGNEKTSKGFDKIIYEGYAHHNVVLVVNSRKYGLLDIKSFQLILECQYDHIQSNSPTNGDLVLTMFKGTRAIIFNCKSRDFMRIPDFDKMIWCQEDICCLNIEGKLYLYNLTTSAFVTKESFESADLFADGYSICTKNKFIYAIFKNGEQRSLPTQYNSTNFTRDKNTLITTSSINNNKNQNYRSYSFHIFKELKYWNSLTLESDKRVYARIKNNLIEILESHHKYGSTVVKTFNFEGIEVYSKSSQYTNKNENYSNTSGQKFKATEYRISDNKLYFNNKLVYHKHSGELYIEKVNDIIRLKVILDVDPETGVLERTLGYLDQFGNVLWEDIFPVCCNCQISDDVIGDWDKYKCNNCNHRLDIDGNCITENCISCNPNFEYEDEAEIESHEYPICEHCGDSNDVSDPGGSYYWCSHCKHDIDAEGICASPNCETCEKENGNDEDCLLILPKCANCGDENDVEVLNNHQYYCSYCKKSLNPKFSINPKYTSLPKRHQVPINEDPSAYYLFIDTETSGLASDINAKASDTANWPRMVQIAWMVFDSSSRLLEREVRVVKPTQFIIPETAVRIHGISNDYAHRYGNSIASVLGEIGPWLEKADVIIGHNIKFDYNVLQAEFYRNRLRIANNDIKLICTMEIGAEICKIKSHSGYKYPKLSELHFKLFQSEFKNNHDALADVDATARCFWKLRELNLV